MPPQLFSNQTKMAGLVTSTVGWPQPGHLNLTLMGKMSGLSSSPNNGRQEHQHRIDGYWKFGRSDGIVIRVCGLRRCDDAGTGGIARLD
jgi:hypothetical protein